MKRLGVIAFVASLAIASMAYAQTAQTENDLRARIAQQPNDAAPYIELAKIYADQRRYDEAIQLLQSAILTLQRAQVMTSPPRNTVTTPTPAVPGGLMAPVRVGGDIKEPKKIRHVAPVYPDAALADRVQGVVILEAIIDTNGNVSDAKVLRSVPLLDQAAVDAVLQWQFTPTVLNGTPVRVIMTVTVNFSLNR
jgi:TonB family protein